MAARKYTIVNRLSSISFCEAYVSIREKFNKKLSSQTLIPHTLLTSKQPSLLQKMSNKWEKYIRTSARKTAKTLSECGLKLDGIVLARGPTRLWPEPLLSTKTTTIITTNDDHHHHHHHHQRQRRWAAQPPTASREPSSRKPWKRRRKRRMTMNRWENSFLKPFL